MNIFPSKEQAYRLIGSQAETLNRLIRRTEYSDRLISRLTDKSFLGEIDGNNFKIIASEIGIGAFCVLSGAINSEGGIIKVTINKGFKILLGILLCFPTLVALMIVLAQPSEFYLILIGAVLLQTLMIRYVVIGIAFTILSKFSLNKIRDTLDLEWTSN